MITRRSIVHKLFFFLMTIILSIPSIAFAAEKDLALFPLAFYIDPSKDFLRQGIRSMLVSRLSGEGIQLVSQDRIDPILNEDDKKGITSRERAEDLAKSLKAHYALFGSITSIGSNYSLDLAIIDLSKDESQLARISEVVNEDELIPKLGDLAQRFRTMMERPSAPARKTTEEALTTPRPFTNKPLFEPQADGHYAIRPTGFKPMGMDFTACDTGDLDGDGEIELVVLSQDKLQIFTKTDETLELKSSLSPGFGSDFFKVSVGDADQNGMAEICVVSRSGESRPKSTVYEWNGTFKKRYEQIGHLQITRSRNNGEAKILFQDSTSINFFSGEIWLMEQDKAGALIKKQKIKGLEDAQFYTLIFFDLNKDGKEEILGLGKPDQSQTARLHIWDKDGEFLWRSEDQFGGTNNIIKLYQGTRRDPIDVPINSKPVVVDVNGDGKEEILIIKNIPSVKMLENFKIFVKANLTAFEIDGIEPVSLWTSKEIEYCITDMQMAGETLFLVGHKGRMAKFGRQVGRIMWIE